jgi:hypothetical protein
MQSPFNTVLKHAQVGFVLHAGGSGRQDAVGAGGCGCHPEQRSHAATA